MVDIDKLRVELSVQQVRDRGGLSYEERGYLRQRIAEIQRPKEKRDRAIEAHRSRVHRGRYVQINRAQGLAIWNLMQKLPVEGTLSIVGQDQTGTVMVRSSYGEQFSLSRIGGYVPLSSGHSNGLSGSGGPGEGSTDASLENGLDNGVAGTAA